MFLAEELSGRITLHNWRAPREIASWKREPVVGAVAITRSRLLVWVNGSKNINVPLDNPLLAAVEVTAESGQVRFGYDAERFGPGRSGTAELLLRTDQGNKILVLLGRR